MQPKIEKPKNYSNHGVIIVPGAGGDVFDDKRFNQLAKALFEKDIAVIRVNLWKNKEEVDSLTISKIHKYINDCIQLLINEKITKIGIIGKSMGGGISLTYHNPKINAMVLWAPAVGTAKVSNLNKMMDAAISTFKTLRNVKLDENNLKKVNQPILLIQGTHDETVRKEDTEKLNLLLSNSTIELIEGAGHSYEKEHELNEVISKTVGFLVQQLKEE